MIKKFPILFAYLLICLFAYLPFAKAQTMENSMYQIQDSDINSFPGQSTESNNNIQEIIDTNKTGFIKEANYLLNLGPHYNPSITPFTFSLSNTFIDFGYPSPTLPSIRTINVLVNNLYSQSYKIIAAENSPPTSTTGAIIPDTTCDGGNCSEVKSGKWTSSLTYGFGYNCKIGNSSGCIPANEKTRQDNFYKQFADTSRAENAVTILSGGTGNAQDAVITFKLNISSSQPSGSYSNEITFLAVPSY
jgi:hypothetical protein